MVVFIWFNFNIKFMENNYKDYLNSFAWKAIKQVKLSQQPECECCWEQATTVHHLSYERRWSEKEEDIVSICERCHNECHFVNGYQIKNDEDILKKRFDEVREIYSNKSFTKKDNNIYFKGEKLIWVDPYSFKVLCNIDVLCEEYFIKDKNYIYFIDGTWNIKKVDNIDSNSFEFISKEYAKDKNWIYSIENDYLNKFNINKLNIIDKDTFKVINEHYVKDKDNIYFIIYWEINILKWVDIDTFQIIGNNKIGFYYEWYYFKDKNNCYYISVCHEIVSDDIDVCHVIVDDDNWELFIKQIVIFWVDLNSFETLKSGYSKDRKNVYFLSEKIYWADSMTFEVYLWSEPIWRDKYYAYDRSNKVEWITPENYFSKVEKDEADSMYNSYLDQEYDYYNNNSNDRWCSYWSFWDDCTTLISNRSD